METLINIDPQDLAVVIRNNLNKIGSTVCDIYINRDGVIDIRYEIHNNKDWFEFIDLYSFYDDIDEAVSLSELSSFLTSSLRLSDIQRLMSQQYNIEFKLSWHKKKLSDKLLKFPNIMNKVKMVEEVIGMHSDQELNAITKNIYDDVNEFDFSIIPDHVCSVVDNSKVDHNLLKYLEDEQDKLETNRYDNVGHMVYRLFHRLSQLDR